MRSAPRIARATACCSSAARPPPAARAFTARSRRPRPDSPDLLQSCSPGESIAQENCGRRSTSWCRCRERAFRAAVRSSPWRWRRARAAPSRHCTSRDAAQAAARCTSASARSSAGRTSSTKGRPTTPSPTRSCNSHAPTRSMCAPPYAATVRPTPRYSARSSRGAMMCWSWGSARGPATHSTSGMSPRCCSSARNARSCSSPNPQSNKLTLPVEQISDPLQRDIRSGISCKLLRIAGIVTLPRENRGQGRAPRTLHRREYAQLVVHHDVTRGRMAPHYRFEHPLLVQIDEHPPLDRIPQAGAAHLARLEHHVSVGQDDGRAEAAAVRQRFQRVGIEAIRKRVVDQKGRDQQELRIVEILQAIALQRAEIVRVSELRAQRLEDGPVVVALRAAELAREMCAEVILYRIVVEQCVVDVEQENDRLGLRHDGDLVGDLIRPPRYHTVISRCSRAPRGTPSWRACSCQASPWCPASRWRYWSGRTRSGPRPTRDTGSDRSGSAGRSDRSSGRRRGSWRRDRRYRPAARPPAERSPERRRHR